MKMLKIILTLCVLSISSSLFASEPTIVYLKLMPPAVGLSETKTIIIECKTKYDAVWNKCATFENGFQMTVAIYDLIEGQEYKFRVILVSKWGMGEPSDATSSILIKRGESYQTEVYCRPPESFPFRSANATVSEKNTTYFGLIGTMKENVTKAPLRAKE